MATIPPNATCIVCGRPLRSDNTSGICRRNPECDRFRSEQARRARGMRPKKYGRSKCRLCPEPIVAQGLCDKHYRRKRRHGDPEIVTTIRGDDEARFWSKVDKDGPVPALRPELGPCWLWLDRLNDDGYGNFAAGGKIHSAPRWAYSHFAAPIPRGLEPDHLCRNRACVNYESHLEVVTRRENVRRGLSFKFPDELIVSLHARWLAGETKRALASEVGMGMTTMQRRFREIANR